MIMSDIVESVSLLFIISVAVSKSKYLVSSNNLLACLLSAHLPWNVFLGILYVQMGSTSASARHAGALETHNQFKSNSSFTILQTLKWCKFRQRVLWENTLSSDFSWETSDLKGLKLFVIFSMTAVKSRKKTTPRIKTLLYLEIKVKCLHIYIIKEICFESRKYIEPKHN